VRAVARIQKKTKQRQFNIFTQSYECNLLDGSGRAAPSTKHKPTQSLTHTKQWQKDRCFTTVQENAARNLSNLQHVVIFLLHE